MRHNKSRNALSSWQMLWILGLIVVVATVGMFISQQLLLDNARTMGKNLVTSYSSDEDRTLREYESMISLGLAYLDDMTSTDCDTEAVCAWAMDFFDKYSRSWLSTRTIHTQWWMDFRPPLTDF